MVHGAYWRPTGQALCISEAQWKDDIKASISKSPLYFLESQPSADARIRVSD